MVENNIRLTALEVSALWTQYMFDSMSICFIKYALEHIEDEDIKEVYQVALELSEEHVRAVKEFFTGENFPIPYGFTDKDVNSKAPRLFQDPFYLYYMYIMILQGLTGYSLSVSTSIRADLRRYFIKCNTDTMNLFENVIDHMLTKGIYTRPPIIMPANSVHFVEQQSFLTGWLGERRPLTAMEIGDISFNMNKMHLHVALKLAFAQVASSNQIRKFIHRGIDISNKHIEIFGTIFREEKLNSPPSWQFYVTNSTTSPFSDKLMMYMVQLSTQIAIAFYGTSLSVSTRRDLGEKYVALNAELGKYAEDGANIMIEQGWLEEPPMASDRRHLIKGINTEDA
jgi:hypothetical protein